MNHKAVEFREFVKLVTAWPLYRVCCIMVPLLGSNLVVKSEIGRRRLESLCAHLSLLIHVRVGVNS